MISSQEQGYCTPRTDQKGAIRSTPNWAVPFLDCRNKGRISREPVEFHAGTFGPHETRMTFDRVYFLDMSRGCRRHKLLRKTTFSHFSEGSPAGVRSRCGGHRCSPSAFSLWSLVSLPVCAFVLFERTNEPKFLVSFDLTPRWHHATKIANELKHPRFAHKMPYRHVIEKVEKVLR